MGRGGARNRSGPGADPGSERSEKRGYRLDALPEEGYEGPIPEFPLIAPEGMSETASERERDIWWEAWQTPQACAWSMQRWRWPVIAEYCRLKAMVENGAPAAYVGQIHRYRDQLGLTPAGLNENGWKIVASKLEQVTENGTPPAPRTGGSRDRVIRSVS